MDALTIDLFQELMKEDHEDSSLLDEIRKLTSLEKPDEVSTLILPAELNGWRW